MKLIPIAANQTEVELENGITIFYSYKTPVAAFIPGKGLIKTTKKWSVTTSKHINRWLDQYSSNTTLTLTDQANLDKLDSLDSQTIEQLF